MEIVTVLWNIVLGVAYNLRTVSGVKQQISKSITPLDPLDRKINMVMPNRSTIFKNFFNLNISPWIFI
jgi:hypothetical protein